MSQIHKHTIPANIADRCLINPQQYEAMYQQSIDAPDTFWGEQGKILDWITPYQKVKNTSFAPGNVSIKWYEDGTLNLAANCLDRHLQENGDRTAIIWEGDDASQSKHISYKELHRDVCRFANTLLELGIKKGDVVAIYMPMVPEAAVADAGLRPHWRGTFGDFRRLLAGSRCRTHYRLQFTTGDHFRRRCACRA